jgi:hypothetical protein
VRRPERHPYLSQPCGSRQSLESSRYNIGEARVTKVEAGRPDQLGGSSAVLESREIASCLVICSILKTNIQEMQPVLHLSSSSFGSFKAFSSEGAGVGIVQEHQQLDCLVGLKGARSR